MKIKVFSKEYEVKDSIKNVRKSIQIAKWATHLEDENEKVEKKDDPNAEIDFSLEVLDNIENYFKDVIKLNKKDLDKLEDLSLNEAMSLLAETVGQVSGGEAQEEPAKK